MKVVHVAADMAREASGLSHAVRGLCREMSSISANVDLYCTDFAGDIGSARPMVFKPWQISGGFQFSPWLAPRLAESASEADVVHCHSLWTMPSIAAGLVVPGRKAALICSPHGTLSKWARSFSRRKKQLVWPVQRRVLSRASLIHVTSDDELFEVRDLGFTCPIALVPNGVDVPTEQVKRVPRRHPKQLLFLSRIHPKKGIDRLLHAWKVLQDVFEEWELVIAGKNEVSHLEECQALVSTLGLRRVRFPGELYGDAKSAAYRDASLFVLPTHSENFGIVVAEALAHGCPSIVSKGAPWSGLVSEGCGWWTTNDVEGLSLALRDALSQPEESLARMGQKGRAWMLRDFSWKSAAERLSEAYQWVIAGGERPSCIVED